MKQRIVFGILAISMIPAIFAAAILHAQIAHKQDRVTEPDAQRELLNEYCADCHNDDVHRGGMSLSQLDLEHPDHTAELTEKMIRKLRVGLMPPPGRPGPDFSTRKAFAARLEAAIDQAASGRPYAGQPALHRLNRTEYANSIRDLLDIQVDVTPLLPPDDMSHGFDNMADVLTVTPSLMEAYLRAAARISRMAVGDTSAPVLTSTYSVQKVESQMHHVDGTPMGTRGGIAVVHNFPADGEYTFKLRLYHHPVGPLFGMNQGKGQQIEVALNKRRVALLDVNPDLSPDGIATARIHIPAGPQLISASFPQKFDGPVEDEVQPVEQTLVDLTFGAVPGTTALPHLRQILITGPFTPSGVSDTPSRRKIFMCRPLAPEEEDPCARKIIATLARGAFRRPVTETDLQQLLNFYRSGRKTGTFDTGISTAIQAILASPEFVFRFERTPPNAAPGESFRITDLELASRLSYFLWSSGPDDRLITLANQGSLHNSAVLTREVHRMLKDPRADALAANFADEWLHLRNLRSANPDPYFYPNFDKTLAQSMQRETELLFSSIVREDHSVLDLISANYTFVNERLARHYGIPNVTGNRFRRVEITDENRKGLLGQGSILMLTSTASRTSPVKRGKYVMEVLLGTPPPPPPPDVPALPENSEARTGHVVNALSVRERLQEHRKNPNCAGCHKLMDPIGFALENFDGVGNWRNKDNGFPIDPAGQMFDGTQLNGPVSLRHALLAHTDEFVGNFTQNLLAYGLGRVLSYRDMPAVRGIDREAAAKDYQFSSFILGIVTSTPFQMRTVETPEPKPITVAAAGAQP